MKLLMLLLCLTWFSRPTVLDPWPSNWSSCLGQRVMVAGTAANAKLGALLQGKDGNLWIDLEAWPTTIDGRAVLVSGKIVSRDDLPLTDDPHSAGMTGTSRQRYLLTDVKLETSDTSR